MYALNHGGKHLKPINHKGRPVQLCVSAPSTAVTMYDAIFSSRTMKFRLPIDYLLVFDGIALFVKVDLALAVYE